MMDSVQHFSHECTMSHYQKSLKLNISSLFVDNVRSGFIKLQSVGQEG